MKLTPLLSMTPDLPPLLLSSRFPRYHSALSEEIHAYESEKNQLSPDPISIIFDILLQIEFKDSHRLLFSQLRNTESEITLLNPVLFYPAPTINKVRLRPPNRGSHSWLTLSSYHTH